MQAKVTEEKQKLHDVQGPLHRQSALSEGKGNNNGEFKDDREQKEPKQCRDLHLINTLCRCINVHSNRVQAIRKCTELVSYLFAKVARVSNVQSDRLNDSNCDIQQDVDNISAEYLECS
jgi:hypothetical protein